MLRRLPEVRARAVRVGAVLLGLALAALGAHPWIAGSQSAASGCQFLTTSPSEIAFCETFDVATANPATRSGDLNATLWGVSRTNTAVNLGQGQYNDFYPAHLLGCGAAQTVLPPNDVRICNGRVQEAVFDNGGQPILALYPKQPFDIAGRTGTVVFDVSADSEGPHAAWPEFWWTDKPVPAPHAPALSAQFPYARHSFGFSLGTDDCGDGTGVESITVTRNYVPADVPFTRTGCVARGSATGALNHFELRISVDRAEVWATDPGSDVVRLIAIADNLGLTFTRGLIWLEHVSYNGCKFNDQCDHTLAWDNVGFDGPSTYRDLSFDVNDARVPVPGGMRLGYPLDQGALSLQVPGVYRNQAPTGAIVTFDWFPYDPVVPSFQVNGGPLHAPAWPFDATTYGWRTIDVPVPLSEVKDGTNTIAFPSTSQAVLSNVNLILIAGSPVPSPNPTPTPAPTPTPSPTPTPTPTPSPTPTPLPVTRTTYGNNGNPWTINLSSSRRIQAENFDRGGESVAYHDLDASNDGGQYRTGEGVDIEVTQDVGGGYDVGWINAGEWLEYTVDVASAGLYEITLRIARQPSGDSLVRVLFGGVDKTGDLTVPSTGGRQAWTNVTKTRVSLSAGRQVLRVYMVGGSFSLNWIRIRPSI